MKPIDRLKVEAALRSFAGAEAYLHSEATSYVFVRNCKVRIDEAHLAGEGPSYRAALRFDGHGWLRSEALTHYTIDGQGRLILAGYDERGRMDVALHVSKEAFPE